MIKFKILIAILFSSLQFISCEEVIDVDLEKSPSKLVIDAAIKWEKGTDGRNQEIKLTTTADYFAGSVPAATGAKVVISRGKSGFTELFQFVEKDKPGVYICDNFVPKIDDSYTLMISYRGEEYAATATLLETPEISSSSQEKRKGFDDDIYEVKYFFQDIKGEDNFYLGSIITKNSVFPQYSTLSDEFSQGNEMFDVFIDDLKPNDTLNFSLESISEQYYNYMSKIVATSGTAGGGPFAVPQASAIRGNIINTTNRENYPLGYFHLSEVASGKIIIE